MGYTDEQFAEFERLSKILIKWLNVNSNPHAVIIINVTSSHLLSGECGVNTHEFIKD